MTKRRAQKKEILGHKVRLAKSFLLMAYRDYIASRRLFIENMFLQGLFLANTSIEKYFKFIAVMKGDNPPNTHNVAGNRLVNPVRNFIPGLAEKLNMEFLSLLAHAYNARYLDTLEEGFNLVVAKRKVLAELDSLVYELEGSLHLFDEKKNPIKRAFHVDVMEHRSRLTQENWKFSGKPKKDYVEAFDKVYEMRILQSGTLYEVDYLAVNVKDDGKFLNEALVVVGGDPLSFSLVYEKYVPQEI